MEWNEWLENDLICMNQSLVKFNKNLRSVSADCIMYSTKCSLQS